MDKLSIKDKLGYSSAAIGDAIAYTFINTYIMFFLTTMAGVRPAMAGTLTVIGAVWNALINPVMGYISDHTRTSRGRRRPFMLGFCIPLAIAIVLLFTAVGVSYEIRVIYYGLMIVLFWTCYTGFFVPFYALGAEYSSDYEERTSIRSFAAFFNIIGTLFGMGLQPVLVDALVKRGFTEAHAWTVTASVLVVILVISILITYRASAGKDICDADVAVQKEKMNIGKMFSEYIQVLELVPMRWLLMCSVFYLIAYTIWLSDLVYFLTYNAGLESASISAVMIFRCLISMAIIPPIIKLCGVTDKRTALLIVMAFGCLGCLAARFSGITGIALIVSVLVFSIIVMATYWQVVPALFYDVCEYDLYKTGKKREGAIVSVQGLVESIASGIGAQALGIILQAKGFDGSSLVQSEQTTEWILNCITWVPVLFMAVAAFALYKYPITRKYYEEIVSEIKGRTVEMKGK